MTNDDRRRLSSDEMTNEEFVASSLRLWSAVGVVFRSSHTTAPAIANPTCANPRRKAMPPSGL